MNFELNCGNSDINRGNFVLKNGLSILPGRTPKSNRPFAETINRRNGKNHAPVLSRPVCLREYFISVFASETAWLANNQAIKTIVERFRIGCYAVCPVGKVTRVGEKMDLSTIKYSGRQLCKLFGTGSTGRAFGAANVKIVVPRHLKPLFASETLGKTFCRTEIVGRRAAAFNCFSDKCFNVYYK